MTREETIEAIKVMQAFVDGEIVQFQRGDAWRPMGDWPAWKFETTKYRIKPPPVEIWVNIYPDQPENGHPRYGGMYSSENKANRGGGDGALTILMREVTGE